MDVLEQMIHQGASFADLVEASLAEGPRWNAVKGHFKKHWPKYALGGAIATGAGLAYATRKKPLTPDQLAGVAAVRQKVNPRPYTPAPWKPTADQARAASKTVSPSMPRRTGIDFVSKKSGRVYHNITPASQYRVLHKGGGHLEV